MIESTNCIFQNKECIHQIPGSLFTANANSKTKLIVWNLSNKTGYEWPPLSEFSFPEDLLHTLEEKGCKEQQIARLFRLTAIHNILVQDPKAKYFKKNDSYFGYCPTKERVKTLSEKKVYSISSSKELNSTIKELSEKIMVLLPWICTRPDDKNFNLIQVHMRNLINDTLIKPETKNFIDDGNIDQYLTSLESNLRQYTLDQLSENPIQQLPNQIEAIINRVSQNIQDNAVELINAGHLLLEVMKFIATSECNLKRDFFQNREPISSNFRKNGRNRDKEKHFDLLVTLAKQIPSTEKKGLFHRLAIVNVCNPYTITHDNKEIPLGKILWMKENIDRCETNLIFGTNQYPSAVYFEERFTEEIQNYLESLFEEIKNHNSEDVTQLFQLLGNLHWSLIHSSPFKKGNDTIAMNTIIALAKTKGFIVSGCIDTINQNALKAFKSCDFSENYCNLIEVTESDI
ncbi:MAG: hypothetical protein VX777_02835 [Chlamydiota bacterium]|nr:hypothetical protein [Chlamydiota bacterium]